MNPHEELKSATEREVVRARQNIEDIHDLTKTVGLNVAKSRALLAGAARIGESLVNVESKRVRPLPTIRRKSEDGSVQGAVAQSFVVGTVSHLVATV